MARYILKQINLRLAVLLLSCWMPVLNVGLAQAQDQCSEAQIKANIAKFKGGKYYGAFFLAPVYDPVVKCQSKSIQPLIEVIRSKKANAEVRYKAANALGNSGIGSESSESDVKALVAVVADKQDDARIRVRAADALGNIDEDSELAIKALVAVVADTSDHPKLDEGTQGTIHFKTTNIGVVVDTLNHVRVYEGTVRFNVTNILEKIAFTLQKQKDQLSTEKLEKLVPEFEKALKVLEEEQDFKDTAENLRSYVTILKEEKQSRWVEQAIEKGAWTWATHALFWVILIFIYPHSSQVQATFFWNPYIRKIFGLGYVGFALTWIPFLRAKLFSPFRNSLLSDADLENFDPESYFKNLEVVRLGKKKQNLFKKPSPK
jgi:hypothetical protein